ncbi:hypothetical protein LEP1GSC202_2623, partial [Leptospira yanagawae serovar Saopaulo str. Sao Paulo = ATCC 700523]
ASSISRFFINRKRLHSKIGYKAPVTFENEFHAYS